MPLNVEFRNSTHSWTLEEKFPEVPTSTVDLVLQVIATHAELEYIRSRFTGLRGTFSTKGVVYVGDDAKFIVANLPLLYVQAAPSRYSLTIEGCPELKIPAVKELRAMMPDLSLRDAVHSIMSPLGDGKCVDLWDFGLEGSEQAMRFCQRKLRGVGIREVHLREVGA